MSQRHILVANVFFAPFSYGGATIVAEEVAAELVRREGFRISAVSLCMRSDLGPYTVIKTQKNGIENYLINVPKDRSYGAMYNNPEVTTRLAELIHTLSPDLVHAHCVQEIGTGIITAADAADVPVILSVHDFWWLCERQFMIRMGGDYCGQSPVKIDKCKGCADNFWAAKLRFSHLQEVGQRVARVTYPSQFAKDLSETSGFAPGRGVVWQNGVRLPNAGFFEKQAQRRAADPRLTFGFIGGPSHIKGWPIIQSAFEGLDRSDFKGLVVDGSLDGSWWTDKNLETLPGHWTIAERFTQNSMDDFYAKVDVLLFMSQWKETFGLAIREALARGLSVIQTNSGGTVEHSAVDEQRLIPIGASPSVLRAQIEDALECPARGRMPVKVTSFAEQAHALVRMVEEIIGTAGQTT
ncbi:MAG: glycosyltransferase [Sulfitobacter sp.]